MSKQLKRIRTPISYYGGKQRIASKIVSYIKAIPHTVYAEPFCGGCSVLYNKGTKDVSNKNYYSEAINDINDRLITFFRVARENPDELERRLSLTLYSRSEHKKALFIYNNANNYSDVDVAWAVYILCNWSFSKTIGRGWSFSCKSQNLTNTFNSKLKILPKCFERLRNVYIDCLDALKFIKYWDRPHTLFYCDPPYLNADQGHYRGYGIKEYQELCNLLDNCKASYILSNYYQDIYPKSAQKVIEIPVTMSASRNKNVPKARTEMLWICDRSGNIEPALKEIAKIDKWKDC